MDVRQSPEYAKYIEFIGWQVEKINKGNVFIKKIPLFGSLIKIQRIDSPISFAEIEKLAKKHRAFQVIIEPSFAPQTPHDYRPLKSPFIPTKTLILDLRQTEEKIFASFWRITWGSGKTFPKRELNFLAISLVISRCGSWSFPTGT